MAYRNVRRFVVGLLLFVSLAMLSSCIVRHRRHHHHHRPRGRRCHTRCAKYAYRTRVQRRCKVWRNGVCVGYRTYRHRTRYCVRRATRCH